SNAVKNSPTSGFNSAGNFLGGQDQSWDLGVALGINYFTHDVRAVVGPTAVLQSKADIDVSATIVESTSLSTSSSTTHDSGLAQQQMGGIDVSVALGFGVYQNTADAIVDSGAHVDARATTDVASSIQYPLGVQTGREPFDIAKNWQQNGLAAF